MKIVVIGGTGLIGSKLVKQLREHGQEAVAASPDSGVNTLTGQGLADVLQGASVVVDVSNSPSFEETAAMNFFTTSTRNLESSIPYSIVHATQFFEFVKGIADAATVGTTVRLAPVLVQPMAADDVAKAVGRIAVGTPANGTVEVAGPQQFRLDELIRQGLRARNDPREVVADSRAGYYGVEVDERTLVPGNDARLGEIRFEDWLGQPALAK
jgi:uncharacterized protein YbjT (DUF2867 family)